MNESSQTEPKLLYRVSEAAESLSICSKQMWLLAKAGKIRSVRIGRSLRIPRTAILEFVDNLQKESATGVECQDPSPLTS